MDGVYTLIILNYEESFQELWFYDKLQCESYFRMTLLIIG